MEIHFNTYNLVKILKQKGFTEEQADGIIDAIVKSHENLATKQDIADTKQYIREIYYKTVIAMGVISSTVAAIIISILKH